MPFFNIYRVFLFLSMLSLLSLSSEANPSGIGHTCTNTSFYTPNSTYQANLGDVLSSLSSNATRDNGFYNATAGRSSTDAVYGLFLCRGDLTTDVCQDCVDTARKEIVKECPGDKKAYIWYTECMLRYSNQPIFSVLEQKPVIYKWNPLDVTDKDRFAQLLTDTMNNTAIHAAAGDQFSKMFATGEANFTTNQTLYSLVQCTPDLSQADCYRCLQGAIAELSTCCNRQQGGRVIYPSCYVHYESYLFYRIIATASPTPTTLSLPPPSTVPISKGKGKISSQTFIAVVAAIGAILVVISMGYCFFVRKAKKKHNSIEEKNMPFSQFDLRTIQVATEFFSSDNKIGQGGFGDVYKGTLGNGQEIAVKRLSRSSGQGEEAFKNEVVSIAKLQHRNLVRLLGFCIERNEKILIYEFVRNKSLDKFLFDPEPQGQLDWSTRYKIIRGIARGILYLHEDSRLRIIHRDLKASNILLDEDMNPKISDFGMARIFGVDQTHGNTNRIAGTYGYMPPEYVTRGQFSVKSDVFSFGVLVLEIISGKKNSSFYGSDGGDGLLSYGWKHWRDGAPLELMDPILRDSYSRNEVIRCINIGLLCVQEDINARLSMASVVLMLNSYSVTLPSPQRPAFILHSITDSNVPREPRSVNEASITELYPR